MTNGIREKQNSAAGQELLRARHEMYAVSDILVVMQVVLTVIVPACGAFVGLLFVDVRPFVAAGSLLLGLTDLLFLDRWQKRLLRAAAKIGERFDCMVLVIADNRFVAGAPVSHEDIHAAAKSYGLRKKQKALEDWYPRVVGDVPLHLARLICQRTNLWYDGSLRGAYAKWVLWIAIVIVAALFIAAFITRASVADFVLGVMVPSAPVLTWSLREYFRQNDTALAQHDLRGAAEAIWDKAKVGDLSVSECESQSRELQNAIFLRRSTSPVIFPGVYDLLRPIYEDQMNKGADKLISEIRI